MFTSVIIHTHRTHPLSFSRKNGKPLQHPNDWRRFLI